MQEVEAKVHISKKDFLRLEKELDKIADFKGKKTKKDVYYGDDKDIYIRTRETDGEFIFNVKDKTVEKGIESNTEIEGKIKDKKNFEKFLSKIGLEPCLKKTKITRAYQLNGFTIELNYVKNLGYFLEIEHIAKSKSQIQKIKKELVRLFKDFGFTEDQFEHKGYMKLLKEAKKDV